MANDLTKHPGVLSHYRFESGALEADAKGLNALTAYNTPTEETGDYQEGSCCVQLTASSSQYFKRDDGDLSTGFPGKSGETPGPFGIAVWFYCNSVTGDEDIAAKYMTQGNKRIWRLYRNGTSLKVVYSRDGGTIYMTTLTLLSGLQAGRWYHVGFGNNGSTRNYSVVYDATAGTETIVSNATINYFPQAGLDAPFTVGCLIDSSGNPSSFFDGKIDDLVIFKVGVTYHHLRQIRQQTFPATGEVARWKFEDSPGFLNDSVGSATLTNTNTVEQDESVYYEGAAAALFTGGTGQCLEIADTSLPAGFPLKNAADSPRCGSFFCMMKPSGTSNKTLFGKLDGSTSNITWELMFVSGYWRHYAGYNGGASNQYNNVVHASFDGVWVAVLVSYDYSANCWTTHMQRMDTGEYYYKRWWPNNILSVSSGPFCIGGRGDGSLCFNGQIDDVRVFDRVVTDTEFFRMAQESYDSQLSAMAIYNAAVIVAYKEPEPGHYTYEGDVPVSVNPAAEEYHPEWTYAGDITAEALPTSDYTYQSPNEYVYVGANIPVEVIPNSQTFNVYTYVGNIPASVLPTSTYLNCVFKYVGNIEIEITPESSYRVPIAGWDIPSGYGCVDFTDLGDPPPFWCIETEGITLALDNTASKFELYAEYSLDVSGGAEVGGECAFDFTKPGVTEVDLRGGVKIGGSFNIETPEPWITTFDAKGGVLVQGALEITTVTPATSLITTMTTRGGVAAGGASGFSTVDPVDLVTTFYLQGGVVVGGRRYPPIEFVDSDPEKVEYEFETHGTIYVGGELEIDIPVPGVYEFSTRRGGVKIGGDCTFGFWQPPVTEFDLMGGVFVEGAIIEDLELYETWALTGFAYSPSMYSGFKFNSYADRNGQILAAREDGIYVLEGGDDDGQEIHDGLRLGPANFGVDNLKGARAIYPGDAGAAPEAHVIAETKGKEGYYKLQRDRFNVSSDILDRLMTIEIADFEKLSHFEIIPVVRVKR